MRRALLASCFLLLLAPALARAASPELITHVVRVTPDTVWVEVTSPVINCGAGMSCGTRWFADPTITPCPLNHPCGSGAYSWHLDSPATVMTLAITPATHFTLAGTYHCQDLMWNGPETACFVEFDYGFYYGSSDLYASAPTPTLHHSWGALKSIYR